ncbi:acyltransferase [Sphaerisporangium sp. NPDC005288]|uniref:acyltransferase n=1 Tax=Sphaerisporangium sp. NPDC005288 TaxID=3155114 RepID=UPI0033A5E561
MTEPRIAATADVDPSATIGTGTVIWHLAQVREHAALGEGCILGRGAYVGPGVRIGDRVKLQNYSLVYEPAVLEDGVFVGPAAVLTNDVYPRSTDIDGTLKRDGDWSAEGVVVRRGASVGARAVILAGRTVGRYALVAAGAVVIRDVPDFALVAGTPARRVGWVGRAGVTLREESPGRWRCPRTGETYIEADGLLTGPEFPAPPAPEREDPSHTAPGDPSETVLGNSSQAAPGDPSQVASGEPFETVPGGPFQAASADPSEAAPGGTS